MSHAIEDAATTPFRLDYRQVHIRFGAGSIAGLADILEANGIGRAMVVCGTSGASNAPLMDALSESGGTRIVGVYDGASPDKRLDDVYGGIERAVESGADAIIGVGGGSSLDIARQISAFHAGGISQDEVLEQAGAGTFVAPSTPPVLPVIVVPTTFAGACLSDGGRIEILGASDAPDGVAVLAAGQSWPIAAVYDPTLFATTPDRIQRNSVMNGFDKGLETLYAPDANALSDAFAIQGVRLMRAGLLELDDPLDDGMATAVAGLVLVLLERRISLIHAFGQAMTASTSLQQGVSHAIFAPPVLRHVFARADGRREAFAAALGIDATVGPGGELADRVVGEVERVRDALALPGRLGEVLDSGAIDPDALVSGVLARTAHLRGAPVGIDLNADDVREIVDAAS